MTNFPPFPPSMFSQWVYSCGSRWAQEDLRGQNWFQREKKIWLQYKNMSRDSRADASAETILLVVNN